jgi:CRP/FNR family cyclic AMP-dependent transcriptional regulator
MPCNPEVLRQVPLFGLLDEEETAVLAGQVELKRFAPRQRIYKIGDTGGRAYVMVSGRVQITTVDEDHQKVIVDEPAAGEFFGFASMLEGTPHQTAALALEETVCVEVEPNDIAVLLQRKPMAGMDMLTVLGRQFHASQQLVRVRTMRNPNEVIEERTTLGDQIADSVARFGGSWAFIISFLVVLIAYTAANVALGRQAWDPYPFILLNLFLSMLAAIQVLAAIQAPVIMMSQNRQDAKDRLRGELDFDVNRRSEREIQGLSKKLNALADKDGRSRGIDAREEVISSRRNAASSVRITAPHPPGRRPKPWPCSAAARPTADGSRSTRCGRQIPPPLPGSGGT